MGHLSKTRRWLGAAAVAAAAIAAAGPAAAAVVMFGDADVVGTGTYGTAPTTGATQQGLAPGAVSFSSTGGIGHGFAGTPGVGDHPGTDQVYVGSSQTAFHDGYSGVAGRLAGPQVITLDFSSLVPGGHVLKTLTLGIAADDFQRPVFGQPFTASINGVAAPALAAVLNALDQSGPQVQYFAIGLDPSIDDGSGVLTLAIDQAGDGGDGWAVDFLTVGVTTALPGAIPEPDALALAGLGLVAAFLVLRSKSD